MTTKKLGSTDLEVFPLCLGGNVFGWTADERTSFAVLDAYAEAGGNFIDTADSYSAWVPGNVGGESETILGKWMQARKNRDRMIIATKVGAAPELKGLSAATIRRGIEASLRRLGTDRVDLYYAHYDDPSTPQDETLRAFDALVREGKVRYLAASNHSAARLASALEIAKREGLARYVALQPEYNLIERDAYERELRPVMEAAGLACLPYYGLAHGFLTGKYRPGASVESPRAGSAAKYLEDPRAMRVLEAVESVAKARGTTIAAVALAALGAQPTVAAPIASARSPEQLAELLPMATIELSHDELARIDAAAR